jgi:predicted ATPase
MFLRIEAKNYRCLREVNQTLNPFEILVGSNASGKSTFLDVVAFLSDLVANGLEAAIETRTSNPHDRSVSCGP